MVAERSQGLGLLGTPPQWTCNVVGRVDASFHQVQGDGEQGLWGGRGEGGALEQGGGEGLGRALWLWRGGPWEQTPGQRALQAERPAGWRDGGRGGDDGRRGAGLRGASWALAGGGT